MSVAMNLVDLQLARKTGKKFNAAHVSLRRGEQVTRVRGQAAMDTNWQEPWDIQSPN